MHVKRIIGGPVEAMEDGMALEDAKTIHNKPS